MIRSLFYVEVPGFYAEVERARDSSLRRRSVIVGGDPRKGGAVQSVTPDAIPAGVVEGMPMLEALELCPNARAVRTDMTRYRGASARLFACLRRACERLEEAGLGAAYFEVSGPGVDPTALAETLRERVRAEVGLPLRVGIAPVKFLARLAAEETADEGVFRLVPEAVDAFLALQPVSRLPGAGANTVATLASHGVRTAGELATLGRGRAEQILGNRGLELLALAQGRDASPLRASQHSNSLSREVRLPSPQIDTGVLSERLLELAEDLEKRLALEGLVARKLVLKLAHPDQRPTTRSRTLGERVATAAEIHPLALALLRRTQAGTRPVRLLGLAVSELGPGGPEDRQLELFPGPA